MSLSVLLASTVIAILASISASAVDPDRIAMAEDWAADLGSVRVDMPMLSFDLYGVRRTAEGEVSVEKRVVLGADGPDLCVIVFVATTCPIANASIPSMKRLHKVVKEAEGELLLVHPDSLATPEAVSRHATERELQMEILLDPKQRLAQHLKATVVPEAFVLEREGMDWKIRYRGPVDDLYAGIGRRRRAATTFHAADAVRRTRTGEPVDIPIRTAFGCAIERMRTR